MRVLCAQSHLHEQNAPTKLIYAFFNYHDKYELAFRSQNIATRKEDSTAKSTLHHCCLFYCNTVRSKLWKLQGVCTGQHIAHALECQLQ